MPYAVFDDVLNRFPPASTLVGSNANTQVTTVEVSSVYISDAEGYVNAFLRAKYSIPLSAEPIITMVTADIAIYRLVEDRLPRIPDFAEKRFIAANSILSMLRDGKMVLSSSQTVQGSGDQEAYSTVGSYHPIFSPVLDAVEQKVDADYVTAEKDTREFDT